MELNSTRVTHFILSAYLDIGVLRYLYFMVVLIMYLMILSSNVFLVWIICTNRTFHEPMYLFLCSLCANQLYGSSGLFPFLLVQILSQVHVVPSQLCFLQIYCLYTYGSIELSLLTVLSYDRYLAICRPLHYNRLMKPSRIAALNAIAWLYSLGINLVFVFGLTAQLELCSNIINKVYCDNYYVVRLACREARFINVFGLCHMFVQIFSLITFIIFTYVRIMRVCFYGSRETRKKALNTCGPHLASIFNFGLGAFFEMLQSRFNVDMMPNMLRVILSLYWLICQPLINPLMYGLKLTKIRLVIHDIFFRGQV